MQFFGWFCHYIVSWILVIFIFNFKAWFLCKNLNWYPFNLHNGHPPTNVRSLGKVLIPKRAKLQYSPCRRLWKKWCEIGGGFNYFFFSHRLPGEMIQFDLKPPISGSFWKKNCYLTSFLRGFLFEWLNIKKSAREKKRRLFEWGSHDFSTSTCSTFGGKVVTLRFLGTLKLNIFIRWTC